MMERLRKLKPSFHAFGSCYNTRIAPVATDSTALLASERSAKCKPHLPLIHQNLTKSRWCSSSSYARPKFAPNPSSSGSKRFSSGAGIVNVVFMLSAFLVTADMHRKYTLMSLVDDRKFGEKVLEMRKEKEFKGVILPATHPHSVKVCSILKKLLDALHRDLDLDENPRVTYHGFADTPVLEPMEGISGKNQLRGEIRDKNQLKGLNWQVVVVDKPGKEAYTLGGGIIVVSSGLLDQTSDAGIASVLAHEVGHSVAQHVVTSMKFACDRFLYKLLKCKLGYPRAEKEASYIGSKLMASAGYDPNVHKNLEINYSEIEANSPSSLKEMPHVYNEACTVYWHIKWGK